VAWPADIAAAEAPEPRGAASSLDRDDGEIRLAGLRQLLLEDHLRGHDPAANSA
jgi:hypothetical protein